MSSTGIYVTIELEKFKQDVIRGIYNCYDIIFSFPDCHKTDYFKMKYLFYELLQKTPVNEKLKFTSPFKIEIPNINIDIPDEQKHLRKDPFSYCYLSDNARMVFDFHLDSIVKYYIRQYYIKYDHESGNRLMTIRMTMTKLKLEEEHFERMIKEYSRFKSWAGMQKKRKNISSSLSTV